MIERVVAVEIRQAEVERRVARLEDAETNLARKMGEGFERLVEADMKAAEKTASLATAVAVVQTRVAIYAGIGSLLGGAAVAAVGRLVLGG